MDRYRLIPAPYPAGAQCLQKYEGFFGQSGHIWRTLDTIGSPEWAADRLAVCLGQMTSEEAAKRNRVRSRKRS